MTLNLFCLTHKVNKTTAKIFCEKLGIKPDLYGSYNINPDNEKMILMRIKQDDFIDIKLNSDENKIMCVCGKLNYYKSEFIKKNSTMYIICNCKRKINVTSKMIIQD